MDYNNFIISDTQAERIAMSILPDIAPYIKAHEKDYTKWLLKQELKELSRKEVK